MDIIFQTLYLTGRESSWYKVIFKGSTRPFFSVEIASDGGEVKFYIRTEKDFQKYVESSFYAQYPTVELIEVPDYTKFVSYDPEKEHLMAREYGLAKPDPFPIKTYDKFGLDKVGLKEEEIQDPMSHLLEIMGSIAPDDTMWLQINFKAEKKDNTKSITWSETIQNRIKKGTWSRHEKVDWSDEAKSIIEELKGTDASDEALIVFNKMTSQTSREKEIIEDIVENISKKSF